MSRISVTIDRIVLRGFDPGLQHTFVDGIKSELSRLLAEPASGIDRARARHVSVLRLGRMPLAPGGTGVRRLGGGIARSIGNRIKP
jgi:hypothetical protein